MKVNLSRINTKDLATLVQRIINSSKAGKYLMIQSNPLLLNLEKFFIQYDAVYARQKFAGKGASVAQADQERAKSFMKIKNFLFGYHQISSLPNAEEAKYLYDLLVSFGKEITAMSYSSKSALLKKVVEALDLSENKQKIQNLGIEEAFNEFKEKHEEFEKMFSEQAEANAGLRKQPTATAMRKDLEKALRSYIDLLTAMREQPQWDGLYADIHEHIKAAKNSSLASKKEMEEKGTSPEEK